MISDAELVLPGKQWKLRLISSSSQTSQECWNLSLRVPWAPDSWMQTGKVKRFNLCIPLVCLQCNVWLQTALSKQPSHHSSLGWILIRSFKCHWANPYTMDCFLHASGQPLFGGSFIIFRKPKQSKVPVHITAHLKAECSYFWTLHIACKWSF